ncbi:putative ribonuclease H-like domain-containing protein [Tanacetum coccineum]
MKRNEWQSVPRVGYHIWRLLGDDVSFGGPRLHGVCVNGVIHWVATQNRAPNMNYSIVAFHLAGLSFELVPQTEYTDKYEAIDLGILDGCLWACLLFAYWILLVEEPMEAELLAKLPDENQILLKIPRQDNMYSFDMKNIVPKDSLTWESIKREYCVASTHQQNGVAERKNRTLIEAARTMLVVFKLPTTFWAEAVSTACYETFSNDFGSIQRVSESSTSSQQDQVNQDCIVIPIWKDASYFGDAVPRSVTDAQIQDKDGLHDENDATEKSHNDSSLQNNGTAIQQVKYAKQNLIKVVEKLVLWPEVNTVPLLTCTVNPDDPVSMANRDGTRTQLDQVLVDACDVDGVYEVEESDSDDDTLVLHKENDAVKQKHDIAGDKAGEYSLQAAVEALENGRRRAFMHILQPNII